MHAQLLKLISNATFYVFVNAHSNNKYSGNCKSRRVHPENFARIIFSRSLLHSKLSISRYCIRYCLICETFQIAKNKKILTERRKLNIFPIFAKFVSRENSGYIQYVLLQIALIGEASGYPKRIYYCHILQCDFLQRVFLFLFIFLLY